MRRKETDAVRAIFMKINVEKKKEKKEDLNIYY